MKFLKLFLFAITLFFIGNITSVHAGLITVVKNGTGIGVVTSQNNTGINCGTDCSETYNSGFALTAQNGTDSYFAGWTWNGTIYRSGVIDFFSSGGDYNITATFNLAKIPTISNITFEKNISDSAQIKGGSVGANGSPVSTDGIVWSTSPNPTIALTTKTSNGHSAGFSPTIWTENGGYQEWAGNGIATGLAPDTTYYVRAYAINGIGTGYSNELTFKSGKPNLTVSLDDPASETAGAKNYGFIAIVKNIGTSSAYTPIINSVQVATKADGAGTITYGTYRTCFQYCDGTPYVTSITNTPNASGSDYYGSSISPGYTKKIKNDGNFYFWEPRGTTQSYKVCVDVENNVDESEEGDNCTPWKNVLVKSTPNIEISASPNSGTPGMTSTINWYVSEADSCKASGDWSGSKTFSGPGTQSVGPLDTIKTYTYTLTCTNPDGDGSASTSVTVSAPIATLTVTTGSPTNITATSAQGTGTIISNGGKTITEAGIVWSIASNPTASSNLGINRGGWAVGGPWSPLLNMTGLTANNTYHVRAYASNDNGATYTYGNDLSFTTINSSTLTVVTGIATSIASTSATSSVTTGGGVDAADAGIVWSTSTTSKPEVGTNQSGINTAGNAVGLKSLNMTPLTADTTYYVRAYARTQESKNNNGPYTYGSNVQFKTLAPVAVLTVVTGQATDIKPTTASASVTTGGVDATGGDVGIVWSTTQNPTVASNLGINKGGLGSGAISLNMTLLTADTTYYVQAYGRTKASKDNNIDYTYGNQVSFKTSAITYTGIWTNSSCPSDCGLSQSTQSKVCTGGNGLCTPPAPPQTCPATSACPPSSCVKDGKQGPGETGIDCGGTCPACKKPPVIIEI